MEDKWTLKTNDRWTKPWQPYRGLNVDDRLQIRGVIIPKYSCHSLFWLFSHLSNIQHNYLVRKLRKIPTRENPDLFIFTYITSKRKPANLLIWEGRTTSSISTEILQKQDISMSYTQHVSAVYLALHSTTLYFNSPDNANSVSWLWLWADCYCLGKPLKVLMQQTDRLTQSVTPPAGGMCGCNS